ncbi:MAG: hypothetical protein ACLFPL_00650 [Candidatus Nanoarchaeia archaeon]
MSVFDLPIYKNHSEVIFLLIEELNTLSQNTTKHKSIIEQHTYTPYPYFQNLTQDIIIGH